MDRLGEPKSIVIFRALQLGDLLCAVPALRALRRAHPDAHIALVGLPWSASFAERFSQYVDELIEFPGYPGLPEIAPKLSEIPAFFTRVQQRKFDAAIQLHGSGSYVNSITALFDAKVTAGFYVSGDFCPDADRFMVWPEDTHEIWRYLNLMQHLGIEARDPSLEFPILPEDYAAFEQLPLAARLKGRPYIVLHPGAQLRSRRWPPERFAEVADTMAAENAVVITGTPAERPLAETVAAAMRREAINLAGQTTLGALAVLLKNARLLLSNDTGVSHVAAALKVPSVIVCSASDPARWAPLDRDRHRTVFVEGIPCRPCPHEQCPIGHPCAVALSVECVTTALEAQSALFPIVMDRSTVAPYT